MMMDMRRGVRVLVVCFLLLSAAGFAQDWKHVHKADDAKWAKATGLDPWSIHKLWRMASSYPD